MYSNKSLALRVVWNLWGLYLCGAGLVESILLPLPAHLIKGGVWQFLTNTSLLVTCLCMFCIISIGVGKALRIKCESIWTTVNILEILCCNLEFIVTVTYWSIILLCPGMLNGKSFAVSWTLDLKIHLLPYVFLLVDVLLLRNNQDVSSTSFTESFGLSVIFLGLYWSLIEINTSILNRDNLTRFPYPFLNNINFMQRIGWLLVFMGLGLINHIFVYYSIKLVTNTKLHVE